MGLLVGVAFVAGIVTALSPCVLPVLPIVLAGGATGGPRRPYAIVAGLVASFTVFTLAATAPARARLSRTTFSAISQSWSCSSSAFLCSSRPSRRPSSGLSRLWAAATRETWAEASSSASAWASSSRPARGRSSPQWRPSPPEPLLGRDGARHGRIRARRRRRPPGVRLRRTTRHEHRGLRKRAPVVRQRTRRRDRR